MKTVVFAMHKKFMTHCMNDEVAMYVNINIDYYFSVLKQTNVVNVQGKHLSLIKFCMLIRN